MKKILAIVCVLNGAIIIKAEDFESKAPDCGSTSIKWYEHFQDDIDALDGKIKKEFVKLSALKNAKNFQELKNNAVINLEKECKLLEEKIKKSHTQNRVSNQESNLLYFDILNLRKSILKLRDINNIQR
jgi:hypothetical protein